MNKPVKLISISNSEKPDKKLKAIFLMNNGNNKTIHFGSKNSKTYLDHKDETIKSNYEKRHIVREDWNNPITAGSLSKHILWNKKTLTESINDYKKKFGL
jgi:hypothetical protein